MTTAAEPATTLAEQLFRMMDFNRDGVLSRADFDTGAAEMARGFGGEPDDPKVRKFLDAMHNWFNGVIEHADSDGDGAVTPAEYKSAMADPRSSGVLAGHTSEIVDALFDFADQNSDGRLDQAEMERMYNALNVSEHSALDPYFTDGITKEACRNLLNGLYPSS